MPDLGRITVFLPNNGIRSQFRMRLLQRLPDACNQALIPPWLGSIEEWVNDTVPLPDPALTVISEQARRLMFIEALKQHPSLFRDENKWQVALSLLKLFDELNLQQAPVADTEEDWMDTVQRAYAIEQQHAHMQQEARLIHTLWHAWYQQLHANNLLDRTSAYILRMRHALKQSADSTHYYAASTYHFSRSEQAYIDELVERKQCTIFEYSNQPAGSEDITRAFIDQAFDFQSLPLRQRSQRFNAAHDCLELPFSFFPANEAEHEARAIDLQIRSWLRQGKQSIGIVSEDRKLSRRLRALLDRAGIPLQDMAGWSLATTSAAAMLERWLECIEEDFDQRPMLDLCKSHFFATDNDHEQQLQDIYRLERDIIQHENIGHGIGRYKKHLGYRLRKLKHWPANSYDSVIRILDRLQTCAEPLVRLYHSKYSRPLSDYLDALIDSLEQLGIDQTFSQDSAGIRIMQTLYDMQHSLHHSNPWLDWPDFRSWLGMSFEDQLFSPQTAASPVQLMTLEQSELNRFDALVIAAADEAHMPGTAASSPFFNQGARKSLGLDDWQRQRDRRLHIFKKLLHASADIIITYKAEDNGEALPLSPWIEALQNFYRLSTGNSLENSRLAGLLKDNPGVLCGDSDVLPEPPGQPGPVIPASLLPKRISAGAHQRLINCPYQFFSGDSLGLRPSDEISEELKKSDYGERVHLILQAFHTKTRKLPAPFRKKITADNRDDAIKHLTELSQAVFKLDLEDNSLHRSWLYRWLKHVPAYIDWQMKHQQDWDIEQTESKLEQTINDALTIFGRLDRIDSNANAVAIIDYKTGRSARQQDVDSGEDVQLATYALLNDRAEYVSYLSLDEKDGRVKNGASLESEELSRLKNETRQRLLTMLGMLNDGAPLHAWGDSQTCSYCNFAGLCRRESWKS